MLRKAINVWSSVAGRLCAAKHELNLDAAVASDWLSKKGANIMKRVARSTLITVACLVAMRMPARASLPAYDGFGGGFRSNIDGANGGTGWTNAWWDTNQGIITSIGGPGTSFPG